MPSGSGGGFRLEAAALCLIAAGVLIAIAGHGPAYAPPPVPRPVAAVGLSPGDDPGPAGAQGRRAGRAWPRPLRYSMPVQVDIPAIGVHARVIPLGANADGSVAVPPLSRPRETSWYDRGPAPGQRGPAAIFGHVDSAWTGPAVFYRLGDLRPGESVRIRRADRVVVVFRVYAVALYPKRAFPTHRVYGSTKGPELRLVTCGGSFDAGSGSYLDNTVVFARLLAVTSA